MAQAAKASAAIGSCRRITRFPAVRTGLQNHTALWNTAFQGGTAATAAPHPEEPGTLRSRLNARPQLIAATRVLHMDRAADTPLSGNRAFRHTTCKR